MSRSLSAELSRIEPLIVLAVTVLVLFFARELLIPLAFALTLAFLLAPVVSRLEDRKLPRVAAVGLTGIVALILACSVGYVVAHQLLDVARNLPTYRENIQDKMAAVHSPTEQAIEKAFKSLGDIAGDLAKSLSTAIPSGVPTPAEAQPVRIVDPDRSQIQTTAELLMSFLRPVGTFGVVIVFTIYLLMKREELRHRILLLAGMGRISIMTQAIQEAATRISQYLLFQVAVNAAYGILFGSDSTSSASPTPPSGESSPESFASSPTSEPPPASSFPSLSPSPLLPTGGRRSSSSSSSCASN